MQNKRIIDDLEQVRSGIENRFSLAGRLLEGAIEVVSHQIEALDQLARVISDRSIGAAAADLSEVAGRFNDLPAEHAQRNAHLAQLSQAGEELHGHIEDMATTLKYLRVFVLNMRITAASSVTDSGSFQSFTEEMIERIEHGFGELGEIDQQLAMLRGQLEAALAVGQGLHDQCSRMLPEVPDRLAADAAAIASFHEKTAHAADQVAALARAIQRKVGEALSALQIGDITRQRIEHVQSGLRMLEGWDFGVADEARRARLTGQFMRMLAHQMDDVVVDFHREASRITRNLSGLALDSAEVVRLQAGAAGDGDSRSGLRGLEEGVAQAVALAHDLGAASRSADEIGRSTGAAVHGLAQRVGIVRMVKADVQRMAINTSLRCSRLGDVGKPLNVIASELGNHAGRLDDTAERTLRALDRLQAVAGDLAAILRQDSEGTDGAFTGRLEGAAGQLRDAADVVDRDLARLTAQGGQVARTLGQTKDHLRLEEDLGDLLGRACQGLREIAGEARAETALESAPGYSALMAQVHKLYTMARERAVHTQYVEAEPAAVEEPDLVLADGLF